MTICCNKPENRNGFQLYDIILTLHLFLVVVASNSSSSLHHLTSISGSAVFFGKLHERLCYDKSDAPQVVRLSRHFKRLTHRNILKQTCHLQALCCQMLFASQHFQNMKMVKKSVFAQTTFFTKRLTTKVIISVITACTGTKISPKMNSLIA